MKAINNIETVDVQDRKWQSPIDVSKYNQSPYLTKSEKEEIKFVLAHKKTWHKKTYIILDRLLAPINDALEVTQASQSTRSSIIKLLLIEIDKKQTTFWSWFEEDWSNIIGYSDSIFTRTYKVPKDSRNHLVAIIYLLFDFQNHRPGGRGLSAYSIATKVFDKELVDKACEQLTQAYLDLGYGKDRAKVRLKGAICDLLMANRNPHLENLTIDLLKSLRENKSLPNYIRRDLLATSCALASLGIIKEPLPVAIKDGELFGNNDATTNISLEWLQWSQRWYNTSTLAPRTRQGTYYQLLKIGRWLYQKHSKINTPEQWNRKLAIEFILEIPVNKTSPGYTKPVDRALGEAIEAWEKIRPSQPSSVDKKDGSIVDFLFMIRGRKLGQAYINDTIIPMLCKKAGIPTKDVKGNITSHRARSTIATQLSTSKDPMTLFELKEWLGHANVNSTISYAKVTSTKLAKSYQDAEYFKRNLRTVEVLIDQDAIASGAATNGEPWKYYDLGHGLCTYDFFSQCKHRMACAGCGFYIPKDSSKAQIIEAKGNLERMLQEIPLTEEEEFAVTEGIEALAKLKAKLTDVPTPSGQTPKQIEEEKKGA